MKPTRFIALLCLFWAAPALAQTEPFPPEVETKLRFIRESLREAERSTRTWETVWGYTFTAITATQLAIIPFVESDGTRTDLWVGAIASGAGRLAFMLQPLPVLKDYPDLEYRVASADSPQARADLLPLAEQLLERGAKNQREARGWLMHVGNVLFNLASGLPLGFGYDRWLSAAISMGAGIAIGEGAIFTSPKKLIEAERRYKAGDYALHAPPRISWWIHPTGAGLRLNF